jgi:hypothetical protein
VRAEGIIWCTASRSQTRVEPSQIVAFTRVTVGVARGPQCHVASGWHDLRISVRMPSTFISRMIDEPSNSFSVNVDYVDFSSRCQNLITAVGKHITSHPFWPSITHHLVTHLFTVSKTQFSRLFGTPYSHRAALLVFTPLYTFLALDPPIFFVIATSDHLIPRLPPFNVPPLTHIFLYPLTRTL